VLLKEKEKKTKIKRMPDTTPAELNAQTTAFSKRILHAPTVLAILLPTPPAPASSQACALRTEPSHPGVRHCLQAGSLGRHSALHAACGTDLWSKATIADAGAALQWSRMYHICIQTGSTFATGIKIQK